MVEALVGVVLGGMLVALAFGLATGRIPWRQDGCCPSDPARDLRMQGHDASDAPHRTTAHEARTAARGENRP